MGDAGTGKTALVSQFMTSEYMHTYDASLGESSFAAPNQYSTDLSTHKSARVSIFRR